MAKSCWRCEVTRAAPKPARVELPTPSNINASVNALIRAQRWTELSGAMRRYARQLRPANKLLLDAMSRQIVRCVLAHAERFADLGPDLADADLPVDQPARACELDEIIGSLRRAMRRHLPAVH
jgi:hypothetical protein